MDAELWTRHALGEGWSLELPIGFATGRGEDGAWSAWDRTRAVDVQTISTPGTTNGGVLSARLMLGAGADSPHVYELNVGPLEGYADLAHERDEIGEVMRLMSCVAAPNNWMSCFIGFRDGADLDWALRVWRSIRFVAG